MNAAGTVIAVFVILAIIIALQLRILKLLSKQARLLEEAKANKPEAEVKAQPVVNIPVNTEPAKGEAKLSGFEDEEYAAVIMAAVCSAANIPLSALKIRSIRRMDSN